MDEDGAYKLRLLPPNEEPPITPPTTPPTTPPETPPNNPPQEPPITPPYKKEYPKPTDIPSKLPGFKGTPWTDWIPLSAQTFNNVVNAQRQKNLANKTRFTLEEAPYFQEIVTNNYAARNARAKMADTARTRAT